MSTALITHGGRLVDLLNITPDDVALEDIAWSLSRLCRFTGHTRRHYSVAEHSMNVARLLPEPIRIYGLLHDAHEAYIGDISTPLKHALGHRLMLQNWLAEVEEPIIAAIHKKLGVPWPVSHHIKAAVKYADVTMMQHELTNLFDGPEVPEPELPMPGWPIEMEPPINVVYQFETLVRRHSDDLRAADKASA